MKLSHVMLATAATAFLSTAAMATEQKSPVFGASGAKLTSAGQNKATVGKGAYADYYGYYGQLYAYYAYYYGSYARYTSQSYSDYYTAYYYAGVAKDNLYNAYYYQYFNQ